MDKKRISAGFIDFFITAAIQSILMFIFILQPFLLIKKPIDMQHLFFLCLLCTFISEIYMIIRDMLGKQSIGKTLLKLKIVDTNSGKQAFLYKRFLRNITWLLGPIEIIYFLITKTRIGDKIAKTNVVYPWGIKNTSG